MTRIALLETLHPAATEALAQAAQVILVAPEPSPNVVAGCAALITRGRGRITEATLAGAGAGLRCVARVGAGVDNIAVDAATRRGVLVLNAPDAFTVTTAEHALMLMLAVARRVAEFDRAVHEGRWDVRADITGGQLAGRLLGLVGLGRIGRRVGELALALGMRVIAWSPHGRDERFPHVELDELLAQADVVSLHLALSDATRGLLDAGR
ncbi:MAG TPA: NAD(P)-dependent oxidoreductase, partial [Limnochordia bacterium]|nr:NAD(P)-dependent oxidoreductase [Limnochordia bacterium]